MKSPLRQQGFFVPCCCKEKGAEPAWLKVPEAISGMRDIKMISYVMNRPLIAPMGPSSPPLFLCC